MRLRFGMLVSALAILGQAEGSAAEGAKAARHARHQHHKAAAASGAVVPPSAPSAPSALSVPEVVERGTASAPLIVESFKSVDDRRQDDDDRKSRGRTDLAMVAFNGILAVFTIALALETRRLRKLARQQASDMQASIRLAERAAETAVALELPLFVIENSGNPELRPKITIKLGNHGRTPAVITADCLVIEVTPSLAPKPCYPMESQVRTASSRIVEQGHSYSIERASALGEEDELRLRRGDGILWVYGYLEYVDFLKNKRVTGFCVAFEPHRHPMYPESPSGGGRWVLEGPAGYTYDRLVEDPLPRAPDGAPEAAGWRDALQNLRRYVPWLRGEH